MKTIGICLLNSYLLELDVPPPSIAMFRMQQSQPWDLETLWLNHIKKYLSREEDPIFFSPGSDLNRNEEKKIFIF